MTIYAQKNEFNITIISINRIKFSRFSNDFTWSLAYFHLVENLENSLARKFSQPKG